MTARFLALYETPADPEAFGRHYREVHIPLARQLPALRRYTVGGQAAAVRGAAYYLIAELEWDTMEDLHAAFASPDNSNADARKRRTACSGNLRRTSKPGAQRTNVGQLTRGKMQTSSSPSRKSADGKISNGPP